jgi:hypothetical protein
MTITRRREAPEWDVRRLRRWGWVALVAWALPVLEPRLAPPSHPGLSPNPRIVVALELPGVEWGGLPTRLRLMELLVLGLGVALLVVSRSEPRARGRRAFVFAATAVVGCLLLASSFARTGDAVLGLLALGALFFAGVAVVAGNRVHKRHPHRRLAAWVAATGGVVVLAFAGYGLADMTPELLQDVHWIAIVLGVAQCAYGLAGAMLCARPSPGSLPCAAVSVLARVLLWALPLLMLFAIFELLREDPPGGGRLAFVGAALTFALKYGLLGYALLVSAAIGLARWLESAAEGAQAEGYAAAFE